MEQKKLLLTADEVAALSDWLEIFILQEIRYYLYGAREEGLPQSEFSAIFDDINYYWILYNKIVSAETPELDDNDIRVLANSLAVGMPSAILDVQIDNPYWILTMSTLWKKCSDIAFEQTEEKADVPNLLAAAKKEDAKKKNSESPNKEEENEENKTENISNNDSSTFKLQNLKSDRKKLKVED